MLASTVAWLGACTQVDTGVLDNFDRPGGGGSDQGVGGTDVHGDGDVQVPDAITGCRSNPDGDPACPEICPELCNAVDDDCDGSVDEDAETVDCVFDNATGDCTGGVCGLSACDEGFGDCDGTLDNGCEVDLATIDDCGACDDACQFDNTVAVCIEGVCEPGECVEPYLDCNGEDGLCETFGSTLMDCGGCGTVCEPPPRATPVCVDGACTVDECLGNFGDCNGEPVDGCELRLDQPSDCGGCGIPCAFVGSMANCDNGACVIVSCSPGFEDCDGSELTACDSLDSDTHCGACGRACTVEALEHVASAGCEARTCLIECEDGFGDCDGDPANGCETPLTGVNNCTGCGIACDPERALGSCDGGSCGIGACDDGWADCDDDPANGCETDTGRPDNCGGCGILCQLDPPIGCNGGTCMGVVCPEGQADCSSPLDDVCEADLSSDETCGSCNVRCAFDEGVDGHGSVGCAVEDARPGQLAWACDVTCADGFADCDGDYRNGCEADLTELDNCGGCGNVCTKSRAMPTCENRRCEVDTCDLDWGDCDGDDLDCETQLNSADDCGACGNDCDYPFAASQCSGSPGNRACVISQCLPVEHRDCDGEVGNGCEIDTRSDPEHCNGCGNECAVGPQVQGGVCIDSACAFTCESNFADCTGAAGCETDLLSPDTCGGCDNDCYAAPQVASATCLPGGGNPVCDVTACADGFGDCNGDPDDGCEVTTTSSEAHCGACSGDPGHQPCQNLPNVDSSSCGGRTCTISSCKAGFEDCDQNPENGCELDMGNDPPCCDPMMDADGDGSDDCADGCPTDPDKVTPGFCGCFVEDGDSDGDGAHDCLDQCRYDALTSTPPCMDLVSNVDPDALTPQGDPTIDCGDVTFDTDALTPTDWCGVTVAPLAASQLVGGPEVAVLPLAGLTVAAGRTLSFVGSRPVVLFVEGDVQVAGTIDVGSKGIATLGAGGNPGGDGCGAGSNGTANTSGNDGGGGGGGGGFGQAGAAGATGNGVGGQGGGGGAENGSAPLTPLRGGCAGGRGGDGWGGAWEMEGGHGGGAIQITATRMLTVASGGVVTAGGGGGRIGNDDEDGGGGGGSGGAILLEANTLDVADGTVAAHGGGGAEGADDGGEQGCHNGGDGTASGPGAGGASCGGINGSAGGTLGGAAPVAPSTAGSESGDGGGGGGGGAGRVHMRLLTDPP